MKLSKIRFHLPQDGAGLKAAIFVDGTKHDLSLATNGMQYRVRERATGKEILVPASAVRNAEPAPVE